MLVTACLYSAIEKGAKPGTDRGGKGFRDLERMCVLAEYTKVRGSGGKGQTARCGSKLSLSP